MNLELIPPTPATLARRPKTDKTQPPAPWRTGFHPDGRPVINVKDFGRARGIKSINSLITAIPECERCSIEANTNGGPQMMAYSTKEGIAAVVINGRKPVCKRIRLKLAKAPGTFDILFGSGNLLESRTPGERSLAHGRLSRQERKEQEALDAAMLAAEERCTLWQFISGDYPGGHGHNVEKPQRALFARTAMRYMRQAGRKLVSGVFVKGGRKPAFPIAALLSAWAELNMYTPAIPPGMTQAAADASGCQPIASTPAVTGGVA